MSSSLIPIVFTRKAYEKVPGSVESNNNANMEQQGNVTPRTPPRRVASSVYSESPAQGMQRKPTTGSRLDYELQKAMDSYRTPPKPAMTVASPSSMGQEVFKNASSGPSQTGGVSQTDFTLVPVKPFKQDGDEPDERRKRHEQKVALERLEGTWLSPNKRPRESYPESRVASLFGLRKINKWALSSNIAAKHSRAELEIG